MIQVEHLTKYYGPIAAVRDISFQVGKGEIIGFLGPNGAGKSTTMRVLTGFTPASGGTASIDGFNVETAPIEVKRRVGYLPERVPLYDEMVVRSFLLYVARVKGIPRRSLRSEVDRVADACGLGDMRRRIIGNLSKGFRQRVGLAQALIGNPAVLILDEPTVGLDPRQIIEIRQLIKDLGSEHTIIISTHILPEVTMLCERVIIINQGRLVAEDSMANLTRGGASSAFLLEIDAPESEALAALRGARDVRRAWRTGPGEFIAEMADSDAGPELARHVVSKGLRLRRLQPRSRSLEDVFMEAVSVEVPGAVESGGEDAGDA